ncbi:EamA family transporter [Streptomyces triticirhizae]|uniref:EamA family transporter n=1 Tax=Streptomyces triticirhizae TaxID=2483353 RepID=A0A3M2MAH5_9ACTN|nr:EamA family transporter [Streptomyces triticirhizae]RMI44128.1 EamA family transporter [Streptomyces triticirhizae]
MTTPVTPGADPVGGGLLGRTALTALAPAVWGTTYVVTTELLPPGHPLFAALLRALPAGLVAVAIGRALPRGAWWGRAAVLGVLNIGLLFPLLFVAAERLPGGVAATLGAVQPLGVALLAVVVLGHGLSARRLAWGVAGVVGVGLVVIGPDAAFDAVGIAAGLLGALGMALGVTLTKRWGRPPGVGPTAFAGWQLTAGGLFLLPLTLLAEGAPPAVDTRAVVGYLWLGVIGGLVTFALWFRGIGILPVTSVAVLGLLSPLVAALLGAALLGETLGPVQLLGFALALAAIVAGQLPGRARPLPGTATRTESRTESRAPTREPAPSPDPGTEPGAGPVTGPGPERATR